MTWPWWRRRRQRLDAAVLGALLSGEHEPAEVAARLGVRPSMVMGSLGRLVAKRLVVRRPPPRPEGPPTVNWQRMARQRVNQPVTLDMSRWRYRLSPVVEWQGLPPAGEAWLPAPEEVTRR